MKNEQQKQFDFSNWYDLWMEQSKIFFDSTDKNLKNLFNQQTAVNPEEHLEQINAWAETIKNHWQSLKLTAELQAYENYFKSVSTMCIDASNMMVQKWIERYKENRPIKNNRELYELWLESCHEVYQAAMHEKTFQIMYGDFMNSTIHYWKTLFGSSTK
jgi:hypothetical protein